MTHRTHTPTTRAAAIADYLNSGDTIAIVAARHGIGRATLGHWVQGLRVDDLAYVGGWEVRGSVRYPLLPERRSA
jgi:transposase-like protein